MRRRIQRHHDGLIKRIRTGLVLFGELLSAPVMAWEATFTIYYGGSASGVPLFDQTLGQVARTFDASVQISAVGSAPNPHVRDAHGGDLRIHHQPDLECQTWRSDSSTSTDTTSEERLVAVIDPLGASRQYHYEDPIRPGLLAGITDEIGDRYVTFAYDADGRVVLRSWHAVAVAGTG